MNNLVNSARIALPLTDLDPAGACILFADGGNTNLATIGRFRGRSRASLWTGQARAVVGLDQPGRSVRLALGGECRTERYRRIGAASGAHRPLAGLAKLILNGRVGRKICL